MIGLPPVTFSKIDGVVTDAGGPGQFRYAGGPKPYLKKKTGKPSPAAAKKVATARRVGKAKQEAISAGTRPTTTSPTKQAPPPPMSREAQFALGEQLRGRAPAAPVVWTKENTPPGLFGGTGTRFPSDFNRSKGWDDGYKGKGFPFTPVGIYSVEEYNTLDKMFPGLLDKYGQIRSEFTKFQDEANKQNKDIWLDEKLRPQSEEFVRRQQEIQNVVDPIIKAWEPAQNELREDARRERLGEAKYAIAKKREATREAKAEAAQPERIAQLERWQNVIKNWKSTSTLEEQNEQRKNFPAEFGGNISYEMKHFTPQAAQTHEDMKKVGRLAGNSWIYNNYLITGKWEPTASVGMTEEEGKDHIAATDKLISNYKVHEPLTVYRGITSQDFYGKGKPGKITHRGEYVKQLLGASPGDIIHNEAFSSASHDQKIAKKYATGPNSAMLHVSLPKGSEAMPVQSALVSYDQHPEVKHVMMGRNSKFRIDKVDKANRAVHVTLLPPGPATDALAVDYTFIPEEHPRIKDPGDWAGRPQESAAPAAPVAPAEPKQVAAPVPEPKGFFGKAFEGLKKMFEGPEFDPRRRKFIKQAAATVAAQHIPQGKLLEAAFKTFGTEPTVTPTAVQSVGAFKTVIFEAGNKLLRNLHSDLGEEYTNEQIELWKDNLEFSRGEELTEQDIKDNFDYLVHDIAESVGTTASEGSPLLPDYISKIRESSSLMDEIYALTGQTENRAFDAFLNPKSLSWFLSTWKKSVTQLASQGYSDFSFDTQGNVINKEGQILPEATENLKKLELELPPPPTYEAEEPQTEEPEEGGELETEEPEYESEETKEKLAEVEEQFQPKPEQFQPKPEQFQPKPEQFQPQPEQFQPKPEQFQPQPEQDYEAEQTPEQKAEAYQRQHEEYEKNFPEAPKYDPIEDEPDHPAKYPLADFTTNYHDIQQKLISGSLEEGDSDFDRALEISDFLQNYGIAKGGGRLYRGLEDNEYSQDLLNQPEGSEFTNPAYSFADPDINVAKNYIRDKGVLMHINVPDEHRGILSYSRLPESWNYFGDKQMSLLDRNTKFRIDKVDKENRQVHVSLVPPEIEESNE